MADIRLFSLSGELASKANSRQLVAYGGKPRIIKSKKARDWTESALVELAVQNGRRAPMAGRVKLTAAVFYASRRPDLDVSLLMDVLEKAGIYNNDRQVHEICATKFYDKERPRVEVKVEETGELWSYEVQTKSQSR